MDNVKNFFSRKSIVIVAFFANTCCIAYSLATRFTDFLFAARTDKIPILAGCLILGAIISGLIYLVIFPSIFRFTHLKKMVISTFICMIIVGLAFSIWYKPPPFPENHFLKVTALGEKSINSQGTRVHIKSIRSISYPSLESKRIPVIELTYDGVWQGVPGSGYEIFVENRTSVSVELTRFMQAGVEIELLTGPENGLVEIDWDGKVITIDLYQPQQGMMIQRFEPAFNWRNADRTRKILVAGALVTDLFVTISFLTTILLAGTQIFSKRVSLDVRKIPLFIIAVFVIGVMILLVQQINTPVEINNPPLEQGVRKALKKPQGYIYQRQLNTLIELNLSHSGISSLEGIQHLSNLSALNLRSNQLQDISQLATLGKLEKLDLRGNSILDISPIAGLERLEYLNLYGNATLQSIKPLASLTNLKKLILGYVPVSSQVDTISTLEALRYINLRNCDVEDTTFLSELPYLEYLNLHSNSGIQDIDPIKNLTNLETLILANIPIRGQANLLANLINLSYLNLRNTGLTDIAFLAELDELEYLNLHSNSAIQSIAPIADLSRLEQLILRDVPINDQFVHLADLSYLKSLNIRNTGIGDPDFLADLMAEGALQDNPKQNITAFVDIRDNPISTGEEDAFASLRPFWQNISIKEPLILPFFALMDAPIVSHPSGFYDTDFLLSITHPNYDANIFYTLDGSEPSTDSQQYTDPIHINSDAYSPLSAAKIEAIAANWEVPKSEIQKAVIFRARAFNSSTGESSPIITHTYFIGQDMRQQYTLPIVSITAEHDDLFNPQDGIYVLGEKYFSIADQDLTEDEKQAVANFNQHGEQWEKPTHFEIFDQSGQPVFSQNGGIRIHGAGSRRSAQKSLRINADCAYDARCLFEFPVFPSQSEEGVNPKYKSIILRNFGQDWLNGMMRDALARDVLSGTGLDLQAQYPVIVFLNGEYWGIYQLQERYDEFYFHNNYGMDIQDVSILRLYGKLFRGNQEDANRFEDLRTFIRTQDLSNPENYAYIDSQVDLKSFTDYMIANIFLANTDWPQNNIYVWRKSLESNDLDLQSEYDGRWRWMINDLDFAFGLQGHGTGYQHNTLQSAQSGSVCGDLLHSLLENDEYKIYFINRFLYHLDTTFTSDRIIGLIDEKQAEMEPEMKEFFDRWGSGDTDLMENWYVEIDEMRQFALNRKEYVMRYISEQFDLEGLFRLRIINDTTLGTVSVNGFQIPDTGSWTGMFFRDIPISISAFPADGAQFSHWVGLEEDQQQLTIQLMGDTDISPVFVSDQSD